MGMTAAAGVQVNDAETQIVAQCRAGNLDAFGQVYLRHEEAVFRHAFYLLAHHEDADDVKQETFLRAYRAFHTFRHDSSLRTWLLRICSNLCYDRLKRRRREPEISYDPEQVRRCLDAASHDTWSDSDPHGCLDRADTLQMLLRVLQTMSLPQRSLIAMHLLEGLGYKEIAQVLGCAPGAAKMRVLRATHQFKARVTALLNEPL